MSRIPPSLWLAPLLLLPALVQAQEQDPRELFERGYFQEHALKQLDQAIGTYRRVAELAGEKDRPLAGRALVRLAACEQARGRDVEAREVLQDVLQRFADVPAVKQEAEQLLGQAKGPRRSLRLYDVQELLSALPDRPAPEVQLVPGLSWDVGGKGSGGGFTFDDGGDVPAGRALEPDQLLDLVTRNVAEDSWANDRNSAEIEGGRLIVTQTAEVHAQIANYLEQLRALRGRVITMEVTLAVLEPAFARELARAAGDGPLPGERVTELERRLRGGQPGTRLLARHRIAAYDRQTVHVSALEEQTYVQQTVNQTGIVPVLNPAVEKGSQGFLAQLRPALVAEGHLLLEVAAGWSRWSMRGVEVEAGDLSAAPERLAGNRLMLPDADLFLVSACQLVRAEATHLVGVMRAPRFASEDAPDPYLAMLVRTEVSRLATGRADAPGSSEPRLLRIHDVSLLTYRPLHADLLPHSAYAFDGEREAGGAIQDETLVELVRRNVAPESWTSDLNTIEVMGEGALAVVNTPEVQAQVEAFLATLRRARGRTLNLELLRLSLTAAELSDLIGTGRAAGPGAFVVPPGAVDQLAGDAKRLLDWADVAVWEGHRVGIRQTGHHSYLRDHLRSAGGPEGSVVVITQPSADVATEGAVLELTAQLLPDGKHVTLDLGLDLSQLKEFGVCPTTTGPIELPRRSTRDHHCAVSFPIDQVLVVSAGVGDPADPLRGVVLLRVRAKNLLGGE